MEIASFTHVGENNLVREVENQDSFRIVRKGDYCIIALSDGAGGYIHSKNASFTACSAAVEYWINNINTVENADEKTLTIMTLDNIRQSLKGKARQENHDYWEYCCTILICLINVQSKNAVMLQVGDSFVCEYSNGEINNILINSKHSRRKLPAFVNRSLAEENCQVIRTKLHSSILFSSDGFEDNLRRDQRFKNTALNSIDFNTLNKFRFLDDTTVISVTDIN